MSCVNHNKCYIKWLCDYDIIGLIKKGLYMSECILHFLEEKNMPSITKKKHTYLMIDGHDQEYMYVLKEGIIKVSVILCDGREFNITYIKDFDVISLLKDEINEFTTSQFRVRIESDTATFYRVPRELFFKNI